MGSDESTESDWPSKILPFLVPSEWDNRPLTLACELCQMLKSIVDEGTYIVSGGGDKTASLQPTIGGVEYHIEITIKGERYE